MQIHSLKLYKTPLLLCLGCIAFYLVFAYDLDRSDFLKLITLYLGLFFLSFKLIQLLKHNFTFLIGLTILFRLLFLFSLPNLSQDFFRFIWDGRLLASGYNPYQYIPTEFSDLTGHVVNQGQVLIEGMGRLSAGHFSNYPSVNQLLFATGGWLSSSSILGSVIVYRLIIILADLGSLYFGRKLLRDLGLGEHRIFWYLLNPFIIIEATGNLHFEAVMVFFLVWALYLLHHKRWILSAVIFGVSVSVKLLPLLFLPLLFKYFRSLEVSKNIPGPGKTSGTWLWKLTGFYIVVLLSVLFTFLPFLSWPVINNYLSSVGLWFGKFEFNASMYYLVRYIGFQVKGYNIIETAGKVLPLITLTIILALSLFRSFNTTRSLLTNMLLAITAYLLLATTVHPWYLAIPLMLSLFTELRYILVWTSMVMLSYFAYSNPAYEESALLLWIEYLLVFGFMGYEFIYKGVFKNSKEISGYSSAKAS